MTQAALFARTLVSRPGYHHGFGAMSQRRSKQSTIFVLLAFVMLCSPAHARMHDLGKSGLWNVEGGRLQDGMSVCSLSAHLDGGRDVNLRVSQGSGSFEIQLSKKGWSIPSDLEVSLRMRMDDNNPWQEEAFGRANWLEFIIPSGPLEEFARQFTNSKAMIFDFSAGDEPYWFVPLQGARSATAIFQRCWARLIGRNTQPFYDAQPNFRKRS